METKFDWEVFKSLFSEMIYTLCTLNDKKLFCSTLKPSNIFIEKD